MFLQNHIMSGGGGGDSGMGFESFPLPRFKTSHLGHFWIPFMLEPNF